MTPLSPTMQEALEFEEDSTCWNCWRCYPNLCKCPPLGSEMDKILAERFICERKLLTETSRRRSAEEVINEILEAAGSGEITLPFVIECAERHRERYSVALIGDETTTRDLNKQTGEGK